MYYALLFFASDCYPFHIQYRLADVAILILLTSNGQVKRFLSPSVVVCVTVNYIRWAYLGIQLSSIV